MKDVSSGAGALLRLIARPAMLWMLFPLAWAVVFPLLRASEAGGIADGSSAAREAVWQGIVLVSAAMGLVISMSRLELQHAVFSWTVPALRARLHAGTVALGGVIAALAAVAAVAGVSASVTVGVMAFGLSLLCVALMGVLLDAAMSRTGRWRAALALFVPTVRPDWVAWLAEQVGMLVGLCLVGVAVLAWRAQFSADAARRRPFLFSGLVAVPSGHALRDFWSRSASEREWRAPLTSSRVAPWLRAAAYEGFGWRGPSYLGNRLIISTVAITFAHFTANPALLMIVGISLSTRALQLARSSRYPLGRRDRMRIAFAGTVVDAAVVALMCAALVPLITLLPVPAFFLPERPPTGPTWSISIATLFALTPIAQWSAARGQDLAASTRNKTLSTARGFMPWVLYAIGVVVVAGSLARIEDVAIVVGSIIALTLATYAVHFIALREHFARADIA